MPKEASIWERVPLPIWPDGRSWIGECESDADLVGLVAAILLDEDENGVPWLLQLDHAGYARWRDRCRGALPSADSEWLDEVRLSAVHARIKADVDESVEHWKSLIANPEAPIWRLSAIAGQDELVRTDDATVDEQRGWWVRNEQRKRNVAENLAEAAEDEREWLAESLMRDTANGWENDGFDRGRNEHRRRIRGLAR